MTEEMFTKQDVIDVLSTEEAKSRSKIIADLGYDMDICECCGQITNVSERDAAVDLAVQYLNELLTEGKLGTAPGFKYKLASHAE